MENYAARKNQEREEMNQRMESGFHELAEQVEAQIRKPSSLEFVVKEQGHRMDSMGNSCIGQLATVISTMNYVASDLNAQIISIMN